jgi:hemolysin III
VSSSHREEVINSLTHGLGLLLSVGGLVVLVVLAALRGTPWHVVSVSIYGATLVLLYTASTLYHALRSPRAKRVFKIIDHSAIYLLIAGTYTPFTLITMRGPWGWTLFGLVWALAAAGIVFKTFFVDRFVIASTIVYVAMGWLVLIAIKPVSAMVPIGGLIWLLAGGLSYTIGVAFFAAPRLRYGHAIWHLFVLGGSISHYFAVLFYVVPPRA